MSALSCPTSSLRPAAPASTRPLPPAGTQTARPPWRPLPSPSPWPVVAVAASAAHQPRQKQQQLPPQHHPQQSGPSHGPAGDDEAARLQQKPGAALQEGNEEDWQRQLPAAAGAKERASHSLFDDARSDPRGPTRLLHAQQEPGRMWADDERAPSSGLSRGGAGGGVPGWEEAGYKRQEFAMSRLDIFPAPARIKDDFVLSPLYGAGRSIREGPGPDRLPGYPPGMPPRRRDGPKEAAAPVRDPEREAFEAELERLQAEQERERQRRAEEKAAAEALAQHEREEREREAREEEERQLRAQREAAEALERAREEAEEAARRAEEERAALLAEKARVAEEEERRKENARRKLLELEARIAARLAEEQDAQAAAKEVQAEQRRDQRKPPPERRGGEWARGLTGQALHGRRWDVPASHQKDSWRPAVPVEQQLEVPGPARQAPPAPWRAEQLSPQAGSALPGLTSSPQLAATGADGRAVAPAKELHEAWPAAPQLQRLLKDHVADGEQSYFGRPHRQEGDDEEGTSAALLDEEDYFRQQVSSRRRLHVAPRPPPQPPARQSSQQTLGKLPLLQFNVVAQPPMSLQAHEDESAEAAATNGGYADVQLERAVADAAEPGEQVGNNPPWLQVDQAQAQVEAAQARTAADAVPAQLQPNERVDGIVTAARGSEIQAVSTAAAPPTSEALPAGALLKVQIGTLQMPLHFGIDVGEPQPVPMVQFGQVAVPAAATILPLGSQVLAGHVGEQECRKPEPTLAQVEHDTAGAAQRKSRAIGVETVASGSQAPRAPAVEGGLPYDTNNRSQYNGSAGGAARKAEPARRPRSTGSHSPASGAVNDHSNSSTTGASGRGSGLLGRGRGRASANIASSLGREGSSVLDDAPQFQARPGRRAGQRRGQIVSTSPADPCSPSADVQEGRTRRQMPNVRRDLRDWGHKIKGKDIKDAWKQKNAQNLQAVDVEVKTSHDESTAQLSPRDGLLLAEVPHLAPTGMPVPLTAASADAQSIPASVNDRLVTTPYRLVIMPYVVAVDIGYVMKHAQPAKMHQALEAGLDKAAATQDGLLDLGQKLPANAITWGSSDGSQEGVRVALTQLEASINLVKQGGMGHSAQPPAGLHLDSPQPLEEAAYTNLQLMPTAPYTTTKLIHFGTAVVALAGAPQLSLPVAEGDEAAQAAEADAEAAASAVVAATFSSDEASSLLTLELSQRDELSKAKERSMAAALPLNLALEAAETAPLLVQAQDHQQQSGAMEEDHEWLQESKAGGLVSFYPGSDNAFRPPTGLGHVALSLPFPGSMFTPPAQLSFAGASYLPTGKAPDWSHVPAPQKQQLPLPPPSAGLLHHQPTRQPPRLAPGLSPPATRSSSTFDSTFQLSGDKSQPAPSWSQAFGGGLLDTSAQQVARGFQLPARITLSPPPSAFLPDNHEEEKIVQFPEELGLGDAPSPMPDISINNSSLGIDVGLQYVGTRSPLRGGPPGHTGAPMTGGGRSRGGIRRGQHRGVGAVGPRGLAYSHVGPGASNIGVGGRGMPFAGPVAEHQPRPRAMPTLWMQGRGAAGTEVRDELLHVPPGPVMTGPLVGRPSASVAPTSPLRQMYRRKGGDVEA
eukprot:SM000143S00714  [mRNA]  locus=s143:63251:69575:+ [translate_table: standard]